MKNRAVFLDKDGTLIKDVPYNVDPGRIELLPGVIEGLQELQDAGYVLIGISNQSGLARGMFSEGQLQQVLQRLTSLLSEHGVNLDKVYYCPHHPEAVVEQYQKKCACRKPMPGMLQQAAKEYAVDLDHSWMIGDILNDIQAGHEACCRAILIDNGNETEWYMTKERIPDFSAESFLEAVKFILDENVKEVRTGGQMYG